MFRNRVSSFLRKLTMSDSSPLKFHDLDLKCKYDDIGRRSSLHLLITDIEHCEYLGKRANEKEND